MQLQANSFLYFKRNVKKFIFSHSLFFFKKTLQIIKTCAIISKSYADMAELADAHGSGPCECKFMQVQVLLSAPKTDKLDKSLSV